MILESSFVVNAVWCIFVDVVLELCSPVQECQVLIVVQAPYAVGTCWLQEVVRLDATHQQQVPLEDLVY